MQIADFTPDSFHNFLAGLESEQASHRQSYYLATQRVFFNRQQATNQNFSKELRRGSGRVLDSATALFADSARNVFNARAVSGGGIVSGDAAAGAHQARHSITVLRLAGARGVTSDTLDANEQNASGPGVYSFLVKSNNQDIRLSVKIDQLDTNEQVLEKVADAINGAGLGLNADIERNNLAGTARLRVDGFAPGAISSVSLRDASRTLLADIGLSTKRFAEGTTGGITEVNDNAVFTIDNATFVSGTNRVALYDGSLTYPIRNTEDGTQMLGGSNRGGGGLYGAHRATINLDAAGTAALQINPDTDAAAQGIESFMDSTGKFLDLLEVHTAHAYSQASGFIRSELDARARSLEDMGIKESNGTYKIERDTLLRDRLDNNPGAVQSLFAGPGGLARRTVFGTLQASIAPMVNFAPAETLSDSSLARITGTFFNSTF